LMSVCARLGLSKIKKQNGEREMREKRRLQ
jgi:hypothetical protein